MVRAVSVLIGIALVAAAVTLWLVVLEDRFDRQPIDVSVIADVPMKVMVEGEVASPGVIELPAGARLNDALIATGGLTDMADVGSLNLAARLRDGETITIPRRSEVASPAPGASPTVGLIDINTAPAAVLDTLPGIGEVLAARIVAHREEFGPFESIDDLSEVEGISESTIDELRHLVTVGD